MRPRGTGEVCCWKSRFAKVLREESRIDSGDKPAPSTLLAAGPSRWGWKPQMLRGACGAGNPVVSGGKGVLRIGLGSILGS